MDSVDRHHFKQELIRLREDERKKRIFDPKWLKFGLDSKYLEQQIKEKEELRKRQMQEEKAMAHHMIELDRKAVETAQLRAEQKRQRDRQIDEFRLQHQKAELRPDWDTLGPHFIRNQKPMRSSEAEDCPVSSLQKFDGEDLKMRERAQTAKETYRCLLDQQRQVNQQLKELEKRRSEQLDRLMADRIRNETERLQQIASERRKRDCETAEFNRQLSLRVRQKSTEGRLRDDQEKTAEIRREISSDFLTEKSGFSQTSNRRLPVDRFKGMSTSEVAQIRQAQLDQIENNRTQMKRLSEAERQEINRILEADRIGRLNQLKREENRRNELKSIRIENGNLAQIQTQLRKIEKANIYCPNPISNVFYDKFGTSSR